MKAGRPSYHIPSKWISIPGSNCMIYFELDSKGNLVRNKANKLGAHHIVKCGQIHGPPLAIDITKEDPKPEPAPPILDEEPTDPLFDIFEFDSAFDDVFFDKPV